MTGIILVVYLFCLQFFYHDFYLTTGISFGFGLFLPTSFKEVSIAQIIVVAIIFILNGINWVVLNTFGQIFQGLSAELLLCVVFIASVLNVVFSHQLGKEVRAILKF